MRLLFCVLAQISVIVALPTIVSPGVEKVTIDTATLSWKINGDVSSDYNIDIVVKEFEHAENPNIKGDDTSFSKGTTTAKIAKLKSGTVYAAYISAVASGKTGPKSTKVVFTTQGIKPPRSLKITTITDTRITFEWSPPTGVTVEATRIRLRNVETNLITSFENQPTPISEYTIKGLTPGKPYVVMIQSIEGDKTSTVLSTGLRMAVGTISLIRVSNIKATEVTVEWNAPASTKNHVITNYEVVLIFSDPTKSTEKSTSFFTSSNKPEETKKVLTDLIPNQFYAIEVRAIYQELGHGPFSKPTFFQTIHQEVPATPTNIKVQSVTKKTASVEWTKPTYKYEIKEYDLQVAKKNTRPEPIIRLNEAGTQYNLGDLESGTEYTVKVRAIGENNVVGQWSVVAAFKTDGPRPVSSVSLTEIKDTSVKVGWTTYTNTTQDFFKIRYHVTEQQSSKEITVKDQTSHTISGLEATTPYVIEVYVVKGGETSTVKKNGLRTNINLDVLSEQPRDLKLKQTKESEVQVTFKKVPNKLVKFYQIHVRGYVLPNVPLIKDYLFPPRIDSDGSRQTETIKNLQSGWRYKFLVRAIYERDEEGTWSTAASIILDGPRPPRVINIFDITDTSAEVHWKPGYDDNDNEPSNLEYIINLYELLGDSSTEQFIKKVKVTSQTSVTFSDNIEATKRYRVKIFSHYKMNGKDMKSSIIQTAFRANSARPTAPVLISKKVTENSATIFWERIRNRSDIQYYEISLGELHGEGTKQFSTSNALEESFTFDGLKKKVFYEFKVRAVVDTDRTGMWLIDTFYVPGAPIKQVKKIDVLKRTSNWVTLSWNAGERGDLAKYEIELKSLERGITEIINTNGLTNTFKLEDLHPGTVYRYRVRAVSITNNDKGTWSESQSFRTEDASILSSGMSTGVIAGIAIGVIALIILIIVVVMLCRKRNSQPFQKFDGSVKFERNPQDGGLPAQEMDDTATAIRNGKKLYI